MTTFATLLREYRGDGHVAACHYPLEHWPMTEEEMRRPGTPVSTPATTPTP